MEDNDIFEKGPKWEPDDTQIHEIRKIQKSIRRRNWRIISISVILAAVLLVVSVCGIIPWVESLYWNPDEMSYRNGTDLEITLQAYTELFAPGYKTSWVAYQRTGFASYELQIRMVSGAQDEVFTARGTLEKNELHLDDMFTSPEGKNYPCGRSSTGKSLTPSETEALREQLGQLPEYIRLEAAVTFAEDLSMEELVRFMQEPVMDSVDIIWMAMRTMEREDGWAPFCGMSFSVGRSYNLVDMEYRCFSGPAGMNPESLEHHFMSLLRYSADQVEKGRGIAPYGDESLYGDILDHVEENGVKTYGVVVTASPQELLELMDSDRVHELLLTDGWIDLGCG